MESTGHIKKAQSNEKFRKEICHCFDDQFFDWKTTVCFYEAIHWLRALAQHRRVDIGRYHEDIKRNIDSNNPQATMVIENYAKKAYQVLYKNSQSARYEPCIGDIDDNEIYSSMFKHSEEKLREFRTYIDKQGFTIS